MFEFLDDVCTPAQVYFVFTMVLVLLISIIVMIKFDFSLGTIILVVNLMTTVLVTFMFMGICALSPTASGVFVGIVIFFNVLSIILGLIGVAKIK